AWQLSDHGASVRGAAFDGPQTLPTAGEDGRVHRWDLHAQTHSLLAASASALGVAAAYGGKVFPWATDTAARGPSGVAIASGGQVARLGPDGATLTTVTVPSEVGVLVTTDQGVAVIGC